jgi:CRP/FNR family transcriptional regulator, cyclic AMP receptor protein
MTNLRSRRISYDHEMADLLNYSAQLPEVELRPGEVVIDEGGEAGGIWILLSGALVVRKGDMQVNTIVRPGAVIGEMSVLLGTEHGATVAATETSRLRYAADGEAWLLSDPAIGMLVAVGLAGRLNYVTSYLADMKHQYGDAPGLSMVGEVLSKLSALPEPTARPGSARDPDPEY